MKIGIQISSLAPLLTTFEGLERCVERLKKTGYDYTQLQWISPCVSADEIACSLGKWEMVSLGTQEKFDACVSRLNDFIEINPKAGSDDICLSTIPDRYFEQAFPDKLIPDMESIVQNIEKEGMHASFHPTIRDFRLINGKYACDHMLEALTQIRVVPDVNQLMRSGVDAGKWIMKYAGRIDFVHLKDSDSFSEGARLTPVGRGITDFASLIPVFRDAGVKYVLAEQEKWDSDPFDAMRESYEYIRSIL